MVWPLGQAALTDATSGVLCPARSSLTPRRTDHDDPLHLRRRRTMPDNTKELARRFLDRINAADLSVIDDLVSDDFVEHEEIPGLEPTKAGLRQMFEMIHTGLQDAK